MLLLISIILIIAAIFLLCKLNTKKRGSLPDIFPNLLNREHFENNDKATPEEEKVVPEEEKVVPEEEKVVPEEEKVVPEEEKVVPEEEKVVPEEEKVVPEEEKSARDKEIGSAMDKYLNNNKECYKKIKNKDMVYYNKFQKAFERFTKENFQKN